ncbi:MAG: WD40/YVTN/BNR-like repeat-containing protein [Cellvibrionaceae bacterium]
MEASVKKIIESSIFVDCCIVTDARPLIIAEKDMGDEYDPWSLLPPAYLVLHNTERNSWGARKFGENTFKWPRAAHTDVEGEMLVVGERGEVWYHGLGDNKQFEKPISEDLIGGVFAIKNIHDTIYVVGNMRTVLRREGVNQWTSISKTIKDDALTTYRAAKKKGNAFHSGFHCIDGFAADKDLYAAGGVGDIWRYDGQNWHPVDIPLPKMHIQAICCAKDGYVYVAGRFGALLKGREDEWQIIKQDKTQEDFRDITAFENTVYVCTEGNLYTIENETIQEVDFGEMGRPFSFSALYANHGKLMATGSFSACLFDGKQWQLLYGSSKADEVAEFALLSDMTDKLEDAIDTLGEAIASTKKNPKP